MRKSLIRLKNILIFSLLSLLLVGCTSEPTELERCIEANLKPPASLPELDRRYIRELCAHSGGSYGKQEGESYKECVERRLGSFEDMFEGFAIDDAKKVCHSQGIY